MTPTTFALDLYRGDTYRWQFALWTDVAHTDPIDLTDVTPKAEIREKPAGSNITLLECSVTAPNIIDVELSSVACAALPAKGAWDLQLTYPSGDVATIVAGAVTVTTDVTDSTSTLRRRSAVSQP